MNPRVQRAVATERESFAELGQADEDQRQQRPAVPRVVEQDVQVVERVLVQEVRFVEEKHRVHALGDTLFDVSAERVEQTAGGRSWGETDGVTELPVEVAATERGVMAVRQPKPGGRNAVA